MVTWVVSHFPDDANFFIKNWGVPSKSFQKALLWAVVPKKSRHVEMAPSSIPYIKILMDSKIILTNGKWLCLVMKKIQSSTCTVVENLAEWRTKWTQGEREIDAKLTQKWMTKRKRNAKRSQYDQRWSKVSKNGHKIDTEFIHKDKDAFEI